MASSTPIGTAMAVAMAVMINVPTIAFLMPPPSTPNGAATCVNKSTLTAGSPRLATEKITASSTTIATSAAMLASSSITRPCSLRRRERGLTTVSGL